MLAAVLADNALRFVFIENGKHRVELRYESESVRTGLRISLASWIVLLARAIPAIVRCPAFHCRRAFFFSQGEHNRGLGPGFAGTSLPLAGSLDSEAQSHPEIGGLECGN
jgi:hypothetical protein